jgi:hypothetical protein
MTADEWTTCDNPRAMFEFVRGRASTRQYRFFGAACCRAVWDLLPDDRLRAAVVCVEEYAAGAASKQSLAACQSRARLAIQELALQARAKTVSQEVAQQPAAERDWSPYFAAYRTATAAGAVALVARPTERAGALAESVLQAFDLVVQAQTAGRPVKDNYKRLFAGHAAVVRCIFGNPFQPVTFDPSWRTESAVALARGMYDSRDFSAAPALADALEAGGCDDAAVLGHLRGGGGHVRGCWVVDGVLGL